MIKINKLIGMINYNCFHLKLIEGVKKEKNVRKFMIFVTSSNTQKV